MPGKILPRPDSLPILAANAALFQLGWFACVLGGDGVALAALLLLLPAHAVLTGTDWREWRLLLLVALTGLATDSLLALAGIFTFERPSAGLIPLWLLCLWVLFATTLRHSLAWLRPRPGLAALFGAVAGPLSYLAGSELAPVTLAQPLALTLSVLALVWGVLFPLLLVVSVRGSR